MEKLKEILFLQGLKGVGPVKINVVYRHAVSNYGWEELISVVKSTEKRLSDHEIDETAKHAITLYETILQTPDYQAITCFDADYPNSLKVLGSRMPPVIYVKGNLSSVSKIGVAFVGTRNPSSRTSAAVKRMVEYAVKHTGVTIISGLAAGCDEIAHVSALETDGITIAVLPNGFDKITPLSHKKIAQRIVENGGCLVSEYLPDVAATKGFFVRRDAIIAALSAGTVIAECSIKSGTMHTADAAYVFQRAIGCYLPKDRGVEYEGNEYIIKNMKGIPITTHSDLGTFLEMFL